MNQATRSDSQTIAEIKADAGQLRCVGAWTVSGIQGLERRLAGLPKALADSGRIDISGITAMDTSGALALVDIVAAWQKAGYRIRLAGARPENQVLIDLVTNRLLGQEPEPARPEFSIIALLGRQSMLKLDQAQGFLSFVGEAALAFCRMLLNPRRLRARVLMANIESAGVNALPIVALLSFLMGVVIAYQGGEQLKLYGANIFIVELVSLTMLREIAPLITAIIVAGRTGSAYAAQIGTMKVTEEIDALRTIGISPMELLVLPKMLALMIALPLLAMFADVLSVFGGMVMAQILLDVSFADFIDRIPQTVTLASFLIGICKAPLFAAVIALVGCYQGFQVSGGADSVGRQTTVSVVQAIFLVIVVDAALAVVLGGFGL